MVNQKRMPLRILILLGLFVALSVVFGKLLAFNIGDTVRISFENLPILLAGVFLGPVYGMTAGIAADLLGCLIVGYAVNPIITAGAAAIGLLGGLIFRLTKRLPLAVSPYLAALAAHTVGSILIKSAGLSVFYGTPYGALLLVRSYYLLIGVLEGSLLLALIKSPAARVLSGILSREGAKEDKAR